MVHNKDIYKKYSRCSECGKLIPSVKTVFDEYHGYLVSTNEGNPERYYDMTGKQREVLILLPVKQLNKRGLDGTLFEEIREFKVKVRCPECKIQCRGRSPYKTDERKSKRKVLQTIDKVGDKIKPVSKEVKYVKPDLPVRLKLAKDHPEDYAKLDFNKIGRPAGPDKYKERVDEWVDIINKSKDTGFDYSLEDVESHLRSRVKRRLDKENEGKEGNQVTCYRYAQSYGI